MRAENMEIRQATGAGEAGAADEPDVPVPPVDETDDENPVIRPTKSMP